MVIVRSAVAKPMLPGWLDRSVHESAMLDDAMEQFARARGTARVERTFMQALVVCEFIAGAYVLAGRPSLPATQQIADAWFHKAGLYWQAACSPEGSILERADYLAGAQNCIQVALSNPEFVRRPYEKLLAMIKEEAVAWKKNIS